MIESANFLIDAVKQRVGEKIADRNVKTVADLLQGRYRGAVVASADDIVERRLRDPAGRCELVERHPALCAECRDPLLYRDPDLHLFSPFVYFTLYFTILIS